MFCVKCGESFPQGAHFCPKCGALVVRVAEASAVSTSAASADKSKKRKHPFLTFCLVIVVIMAVVGSYAVEVSSDRAQNDLLVWMIHFFECITFFFLIITILSLTFFASWFQEFSATSLVKTSSGL